MCGHIVMATKHSKNIALQTRAFPLSKKIFGFVQNYKICLQTTITDAYYLAPAVVTITIRCKMGYKYMNVCVVWCPTVFVGRPAHILQ